MQEQVKHSELANGLDRVQSLSDQRFGALWWKLVKEYIDDRYSDAEMDRPGLKEMRQDLKRIVNSVPESS